jgi:hypothetical protein
MVRATKEQLGHDSGGVLLSPGKILLLPLEAIADSHCLGCGGYWPEGETNHSVALLLILQPFLALHSAGRRKKD